MSAAVLVVLAAVSSIAAVISAMTGVAGGIILLSVLLVSIDPRAVVPVHGSVQLVANVTRLVVFWRHVQWSVVVRFALASLPGAMAGAALVSLLSPRALQIAIAGAILVSLLSKPKKDTLLQRSRLRWFYPLGLLCGALGMLVGSTGPIVTQGLLWAGVTKEPHVATKAACQGIANVIKIVLYGATLGFAFGDHATLIAVMSIGSVAGTVLGKRLLSKVSDATFITATRVLLAIVAIKSLVGA